MSRHRLALALLVSLCACRGTAAPAPVSTNNLALTAPIEFEQEPPMPPSEEDEFSVYDLAPSPPRQAFLDQLPGKISPRLGEDGSLEFHPDFDRLEDQLTLERAVLPKPEGLVQKTAERMKLAFEHPEELVAENAQELKYARAHRGKAGEDDSYEPLSSTPSSPLHEYQLGAGGSVYS